MATSLNEALRAALQLPERDRITLVDALIEKLEPEINGSLDPEWLAEIQRRSDEIDRGLVQAIPWDEVKRRTRQRKKSNGRHPPSPRRRS